MGQPQRFFERTAQTSRSVQSTTTPAANAAIQPASASAAAISAATTATIQPASTSAVQPASTSADAATISSAKQSLRTAATATIVWWVSRILNFFIYFDDKNSMDFFTGARTLRKFVKRHYDAFHI